MSDTLLFTRSVLSVVGVAVLVWLVARFLARCVRLYLWMRSIRKGTRIGPRRVDRRGR